MGKFRSTWDGHLRQIKPAKHKIQVSFDHLPTGDQYTQYHIELDQISLGSRKMESPRCSNWKSYTLLRLKGHRQFSSHPKKNGTLWSLVDYEKVNDVTVCGSYSIPPSTNPQTQLDMASFSTVYTNSRCSQVEAFKADGNKAEFSSHQGLFKFDCMKLELSDERRKSRVQWISSHLQSKSKLHWCPSKISWYFERGQMRISNTCANI